MSPATAQPRTLNEARTLANIATRANSLLTDGYTVERWKSDPDRFSVYKPGEKLNPAYLVNVRMQFCSCECWEQRHTCKHLLAVNAIDEQDRHADEQYALWLLEHETL